MVFAAGIVLTPQHSALWNIAFHNAECARVFVVIQVIEAIMNIHESFWGEPVKLRRRSFLNLAAAAAVLPTLPGIARAQAYPTRPVRWIVAAAAGSAPDIVARLVGPRLSDRLGQHVIIDNRPGAGGNIGTQTVVNAPSDGYTLLLLTDAHAINVTLYDKLTFNLIRDIAPVASVVRVPFVMVVNPAVPAKTILDFIAYAKANPGKLTVASSGNGTVSHVAGEMFKMMAGVEMLNVPYRSSPPALTDLIGGYVQVYFGALPLTIEHIRAGKLRPLAMLGATRSKQLPDVPPIADFVPGYDASAMYGVGVSRNTPSEIIDRLHKEIAAIASEPEMVARLIELGTPVRSRRTSTASLSPKKSTSGQR